MCAYIGILYYRKGCITVKQTYYKSDNGDLKSLLGNVSSADLIIMISNGDMFEKHVAELHAKYPDIPSIGTTGHFYSSSLREGGVGLVAMSGVRAAAGILTSVSTMPMKDISEFENNVRKVNANGNNTVCIDFCTGNDAMTIAAMNTVLRKSGISLMGGTAFDGKVSVNGVVYQDACAYAIVRNESGKVKVYKENLYRPMDDRRFIASGTDRAKYYIGELNGKPAKAVYMNEFGISERDISKQTFSNPFGKITGNEICIISLKEPSGSGLCCYRQVNDSDVLTLLQIGNHAEIAAETISRIRADFSNISGVFAVNCAFRYLYFKEHNFLTSYLQSMSKLGSFCGFVGNGEHYNDQFINQTMSCVVFG